MRCSLASSATLALLVVSAACAGDRAPASNDAAGSTAIAPALAAMSAEGLMRHTKALSDDSLEGRGPATPGEDKAVAYLVGQFKQLGLSSGNPDGSFVQNATLLGFTAHPEASFNIGNRTIALSFPSDYVAVSRHDKPVIDVNAEMIFVGYGVDAPEYGWDDYKGIDVKGKVVVMLINDPAVPDPKDSTTRDSSMFKGNAMTYYGRWTYKYEIASAKGAAGAIIIHETGPAGYPYEVVSGSWGRENFDIAQPEALNTRTQAEGLQTGGPWRVGKISCAQRDADGQVPQCRRTARRP